MPGGDARLPALQGRVQGPHDPVRVPPGPGRQVDARGPLYLHEVPLQLAAERALALLVDQVPLVRDDHQGAPGVDDLLDDAHVLLGEGLGAVDEDQGDLGLLDGRLRADGGVVVRARRAVRLAADPGGVDEPPGAPVELDELVDRIAGGAGQLVDDDARGPGQRVEQRRLADVGPPHQGDAPGPARGRGGGVRRLVGQYGGDGVEQVPHAPPVQRGHRVGLAHAQPPQVGGVRLLHRGVDLVGR